MNRKGIGPLVTTLLLIAIAVAASVLTYWWVMDMMGSSQSPQHTSTINIREVQFSSGSDFKYLLTLTNGTLKIMWMDNSVIEKIVLNRDIQITYYRDSMGKLWIVNVEK